MFALNENKKKQGFRQKNAKKDKVEKKMPKQATSVFEQVFTLENDGLSQTSTRHIFFAGDIHGPTKIQVNTHLPPFVLPNYWADYKLSQKDVLVLVDRLPAQLLWLSCLVHGIDVTAACLKPSYARVDEILISYRALAIRTLIARAGCIFRHKMQILDTTSAASLEHVPPLPTQEVHESVIPEITRLLAPRLRAFEVCEVLGLYNLNGKQYLPVKLEGDAILLQRATRFENFERSQKRQKYGCATIPFLITTPDTQRFALCEDCVLVTSKQ